MAIQLPVVDFVCIFYRSDTSDLLQMIFSNSNNLDNLTQLKHLEDLSQEHDMYTTLAEFCPTNFPTNN